MPPLLASCVLAAPALAQPGGGPPAETPPLTGRLTGVVWDSLAGRPLAGATVLGPAGRLAVADAQGRWTLDALPPGPTALGFAHPALDSLGLADLGDEAPPVTVVAGRATAVTLATPSGATLVRRLCPDTATAASAGVVFGTVADARDTYFAGARVTVRWTPLAVGSVVGGAAPVARTVASDGRGVYAACGVPVEEQVTVVGQTDRGRTSAVDVLVPAWRVARLDLVLAATPAAPVAGAGVRPAAVATPAAAVRQGVLAGTVVAPDGHPLANVQVGLLGDDGEAPATTVRTDSAGTFRLTGPEGTRTVQVVGIGYLPARRVVALRGGEATEVRVQMRRVQTLTTVNVNARFTEQFFRELDFRRLRGATSATIKTAEQLERIPTLGSAFEDVPGLYVTRGRNPREFRLFNKRTDGGDCPNGPDIYLDGFFQPGGTSMLWDLTPGVLAAVEVYTSNPPATLATRLSYCGAVFLWTRHHARMP